MIPAHQPEEQTGSGYAESGPSGIPNPDSSPTEPSDHDFDVSDDDEQPTNRCRNCRLPTDGGLVCKRCLPLPRCTACKKYLSADHFPNPDDSRCETCIKKVGKPRVRRAAENSAREVEIPIDSLDLREFVSDHAETIDRIVQQDASQHGSVKFFVSIRAEFSRATEDGDQFSTAGFRTSPMFSYNYDVTDIVSQLNEQIEGYNNRSSSWNLVGS